MEETATNNSLQEITGGAIASDNDVARNTPLSYAGELG